MEFGTIEEAMVEITSLRAKMEIAQANHETLNRFLRNFEEGRVHDWERIKKLKKEVEQLEGRLRSIGQICGGSSSPELREYRFPANIKFGEVLRMMDPLL